MECLDPPLKYDISYKHTREKNIDNKENLLTGDDLLLNMVSKCPLVNMH